MYVKVEDMNCYNQVVTKVGWYYKWFRDIYLLCELKEESLYKHRFLHENKLNENWYFDVEYLCEIKNDERENEETTQIEKIIDFVYIKFFIDIERIFDGYPDINNEPQFKKWKIDTKKKTVTSTFTTSKVDTKKKTITSTFTSSKIDTISNLTSKRLKLNESKKSSKSKSIVDSNEDILGKISIVCDY